MGHVQIEVLDRLEQGAHQIRLLSSIHLKTEAELTSETL
jgi:hypothetical protein